MKLFQIDAFADRPFAGNPAGVCLLDRGVEDSWMQAVAAEMNLSETAFVSPGDEGFGLRWFTPIVEVSLCGHATLASAHVLYETGRESGTISFSTKSGVLRADREGDRIRLDFPALSLSPIPVPKGLAEALGTAVGFTGSSQLDLLVELENEDSVAKLEPDFKALLELETRGLIVTARADGEYDFVSRFFAPSVGINEDPASGSAHCVLGPFWAERLGRDELSARQLSARGASIGVRVRGERVELLGKAQTIFEAELSA